MDEKRELLKRIAVEFRRMGFKGSGHHYRRRDEELICALNIQGSSGGSHFYINLGAQPEWLPLALGGTADESTLKAVDCLFRGRVGRDWGWHPDEAQFRDIIEAVGREQGRFLERPRAFCRAVSTGSVEDVLAQHASSFMRLQLARGCLARGLHQRSRDIAQAALRDDDGAHSGVHSDLTKLARPSPSSGEG